MPLKRLRLALLAAAGAASVPAWSAAYEFNVLYLGQGEATLVAGSTDPRSVTLVEGDSFAWTVSAQPGRTWTVLAGGTVFPMFALGVNEPADRTGDFVFTLTNQGTTVLTQSETASVQSEVHMGTNTVTLTTGLVFDRLHLAYSLTTVAGISVVPDPDNDGASITVRGGPVGSTPTGLLPIFGMLDATTTGNTSTTVYGPVPEPATWALWLVGVGAAGALARRRSAA